MAFSYLSNPDMYDAKMASTPELMEIDEQLKESHGEVVDRFYKLFESIYKYVKDLTRFLDDVEEGVYMQLRLVNCRKGGWACAHENLQDQLP